MKAVISLKSLVLETSFSEFLTCFLIILLSIFQECQIFRNVNFIEIEMERSVKQNGFNLQRKLVSYD